MEDTPLPAVASRPPGTPSRPPSGLLPGINATNSDVILESSSFFPEVEWSSEDLLREEPWVVPLLAFSAANLILILSFEVFVIAKALSGRPSRRHFFLGQCLLAGLALMIIFSLCLVLEPSFFLCVASRVLIGISPAIVFGALLVKCVFLISLHSGVYLPANYQGLLLFFIILVQGVISIQWLATYPAKAKQEGHVGNSYSICETSYKHFVISLMYIMVLILIVAVLSMKCRRVRENYRESSYIAFCMCVIVPLWISWPLVGFALHPRLQPACLGFGSAATATVIFIIMFIPKGRQMTAAGKSGTFKEDVDSSSTSSSEKYASPSFFMFKPVKASSKHILKADDFSVYKANESGVYPPSTDEGSIYATITPKDDHAISSNPNVYLFRSHSNVEMFY